MIKISQLPDAEKYDGGEVIPIVQDGVTKKASPLFTDVEMKVHVPENAAIVTSVEGTEINLLSAKVLDGVVTVFVGDKEVSLYQDSSIIVTEPAVSDGNTYVRINNKWSVRNPVTQINSIAAPTGGGKIDLIASDVKAHIENSKRDGIAYVSRDGTWIKLSEGLQVELDKKADKVHTHEIADVTDLETALDGKADKVHTHVIADVTGLEAKLTDIEESIATHQSEIGDVTGLRTELDNLNTSITAVDTKLDTEIGEVNTKIDGKADKTHNHAIADVTGLSDKLSTIDQNVSTIETSLNGVKDEINVSYINVRVTTFTGTEASGKIPLEAVGEKEMAVTDNTITASNDGYYFIQLNVNIESEGTVVTLTGVPNMIIDGQGSKTVSGVFELTDASVLSLDYTGENSVISANITAHKI